MTEYSVEIERMVVRLENLFVEGASLEPALLDRLRIQIGKLEETAALESDQVHVWWNDLNHDFMRLNQNYQDYMRELNSVRAEELMRTQEFLVFKDRLIDYLRSFVQSLQMNVGKIEQHLKKADPQIVAKLLDKVTQFELSVPRMDVEVKEEQIRERMEGAVSEHSQLVCGRRRGGIGRRRRCLILPMRLSGKLPGMPRGISEARETEDKPAGRSIRSWRPCSQSAGISGRRTACPPWCLG